MDDPLVYYFPEFATFNPETTEAKIYTILYTLLLFTIVFIVSFLASYNFHTFKNVLRTKEKVFWCLAFVRAIFGFTGSAIGFYYLAMDDTLKKDVVHAKTISSILATYYAIGFFIFECAAFYISCVVFRFFDKFLFLHHTYSLFCYSLVGYYDKGHYFSAVGLILESSTPFTCLCWMLLKTDYAHTLLWKVNQLILVHLFHCRTIIEAYLLFVSYYQWNAIRSEMPVPLFWCLYTIVPLQLTVVTPYWTYKKTEQLMNTKPKDFNHSDKQRLSNDINTKIHSE